MSPVPPQLAPLLKGLSQQKAGERGPPGKRKRNVNGRNKTREKSFLVAYCKNGSRLQKV